MMMGIAPITCNDLTISLSLSLLFTDNRSNICTGRRSRCRNQQFRIIYRKHRTQALLGNLVACLQSLRIL